MRAGDADLPAVGALRLSQDVAYRLVDREAIVDGEVGNEVMVLDEVAARFVDLVTRGESATAAAATLLDEYELDPSAIEADLLRLLDELLERGILERAGG